jgi:hypothetical protein
MAVTSFTVVVSGTHGPEPMTLRSSFATSDMARQCVAAGAKASARRPAAHRENRLRTAFIDAMSRPEPSNSSYSAMRSASFIPRNGAPIRLDVPPEMRTIATSLPRRPEVTSAILAAAENELRPGSG